MRRSREPWGCGGTWEGVGGKRLGRRPLRGRGEGEGCRGDKVGGGHMLRAKDLTGGMGRLQKQRAETSKFGYHFCCASATL